VAQADYQGGPGIRPSGAGMQLRCVLMSLSEQHAGMLAGGLVFSCSGAKAERLQA